MRKLWTLATATVMAIAFFIAGSPAANAWGTEVLGCNWGSGWIANYCGGGGWEPVTFSPHNLSGTYSYNWTITVTAGSTTSTVTNQCNAITYPCIQSGCTATSSTCTINTAGGLHDTTLTASLRLTQSGQSRTIQASATIYADPPCKTC